MTRPVAAVAVLMMAWGCGRPPTAGTLAEGYVRAALQLAQHDPSLVETWRGDPSWKPGPRRPVRPVLDDLERVRSGLQLALTDVSAAAEQSRLRYLLGQTSALIFVAERLLGRQASIDDQIVEEFDAVPEPLDDEHMTRVRAQIEAVVPGNGGLPQRLLALRQRTAIAAERSESALVAALDACRSATQKTIELPSDDRVSLTFSATLEWDGFTTYDGGNHSTIAIARRAPLDVARALRLACHEGYPGHHVQHVLLDRARRELGWPELDLVPAFGRHLLLAEGAAEVAADLAFSFDERVRVYRDRLLPAANLPPGEAETLARLDELVPELLPIVTDVARKYLDGRLDRQQALDRLEREALILNAEGTLVLIERRRARALVYGEGRWFLRGLHAATSLSALHSAIANGSAVQ